jgi:hypothetical protein
MFSLSRAYRFIYIIYFFFSFNLKNSYVDVYSLLIMLITFSVLCKSVV